MSRNCYSVTFISDNPVQPPNFVRVVFDHKNFFFFVNVLILPKSACSIFFLLGRRTPWISPAFVSYNFSRDSRLDFTLNSTIPQFTSNLWFKLCHMLHISHKQTTAYHPEPNGAVGRLHRRLKNALCARAAAATWSKELPFVLLRLWAQPRKRHWSSPAEAVFGAPFVLSNEFLQNEEMSVDAIIKNVSKTLHVPAVSLPRHNSSAQLPNELPGELLSAPLVWVHRGGVIPPLQPLYDGHYAVLHRGPCSFTILVESRDEVIAVSRLKACTAADATPGSPRRWGRPLGSHRGGPATTKQVLFSDMLVSSPSPAPPRDEPGTVFLPGEEVLARPGLAAPSQVPQMLYQSRQQAPPQRLDLWPILLPAEARARGEPCGHLQHPWRRSDQLGVLQ